MFCVGVLQAEEGIKKEFLQKESKVTEQLFHLKRFFSF